MFARSTKILIVDDMVAMRNILRKNLSDLGLRNVIEADDGEDAWDEIGIALNHNAPIQLILSDWHMPRMEGIALLRKVRTFAETHLTPFLMLLAESEKGLIAEAMHSGATDCLFKPIEPTKFAEKLFSVWQKTQKK